MKSIYLIARYQGTHPVYSWLFSCNRSEPDGSLHHVTMPHYNDVIISAIASLITSLTSVYSTVYSGADKKKSKLHVTGLCVGNSPVTGEFPAQMASNAENVSTWWRHHGSCKYTLSTPGLCRLSLCKWICSCIRYIWGSLFSHLFIPYWLCASNSIVHSVNTFERHQIAHIW